jgi:hypothetical protein
MGGSKISQLAPAALAEETPLPYLSGGQNWREFCHGCLRHNGGLCSKTFIITYWHILCFFIQAIRGVAIMKKVCINFGTGCPRAMLDAALMVDYFSKNDWELTSDFAESDIIIASTCGVTGRAEDISLNHFCPVKPKRGRTGY